MTYKALKTVLACLYGKELARILISKNLPARVIVNEFSCNIARLKEIICLAEKGYFRRILS